MSTVKAQLEGRITRLFAEGGERLEERPLLPSMSTLLAAAAGNADATDQVSKEALDLFGRKLTGLLPVGFTPEGTGPLRVLVTYPRVEAVEEVEQYLGKALRLPSDARNSVEYRGVESDSVTVVLFRSEMSLTQVPEARKVLRQWARAKDNEQAQDVLRWRQRLGYKDSWMVSGEEDRRVILHRLLCCMWNGQVDVVDGENASPDRVRLRLHPEKGPQVPGVRLRLGEFPGGVSSWAELLRSYERWTVLDDEITVEDYCRELMSAQPLGLTRSSSDPHPLFVELVEKVAPRQLELLAERRERDGERVEGWVRPSGSSGRRLSRPPWTPSSATNAPSSRPCAPSSNTSAAAPWPPAAAPPRPPPDALSTTRTTGERHHGPGALGGRVRGRRGQHRCVRRQFTSQE